uniref:VWFA domain-containing protein n=1 Tax=Strongyloides stercoralis TaxID=6248 RepID=A0AAF5I2Z2_STRER
MILVDMEWGIKVEETNGEMDKMLLESFSNQNELASNTKANIFIINDVSSSVPASKYADTLTNFLMNIFINFEINPKYINIAFSPSPGDSNLWVYLPTFNMYNDTTLLRNNINSSYYPIEGQQSHGQKQLGSIIQFALNPEFLKTGYDGSYKPHIIFYLTTTSSPDSDTIKQAQKVINNGKFKIITIAYQPTDNVESLEKMSSCFFKATNENNLLSLSIALSRKITTASSTGTEYQC